MKTTSSQIQKPMIEYNHKATVMKFLKSGRKYRPFAITKKVNPEGFARFMSKDYMPKRGGEHETGYLLALQSEGLLVLKRKTLFSTMIE